MSRVKTEPDSFDRELLSLLPRSSNELRHYKGRSPGTIFKRLNFLIAKELVFKFQPEWHAHGRPPVMYYPLERGAEQ